MAQHNRPQFTEGLARLFALKGEDSRGFDLEKGIVPTMSVAALLETPYVTGLCRPGLGNITALNVAAQQSITVLRCGRHAALQVLEITCINLNAAAMQFNVGQTSDAGVAAFTTPFGTGPNPVPLTSAPDSQSNDAPVLSSAMMGNAADAGIPILSTLQAVMVPANDSRVITMPPNQLTLFGDSFWRNLIIVGGTPNFIVRTSFQVREWPLHG